MDRAHILRSPVLIAALGLLVLNDFVLKPVFHNWVTGKISDVAGLFIFPLFLSVVAGGYKTLIYFATAAGFIFWKATYSQPLIDFFNARFSARIGRTADLSDVMALFVLPLSWCYAAHAADAGPRPASTAKMLVAIAVSTLCVFAFAATSSLPPDEQSITYRKDYSFDLPQEQLVQRLESLELRSFSKDVADRANGYLLHARLERDICRSAGARITMMVFSRGWNNSTRRFFSIVYPCRSRLSGDQQ